MSRPSWLTEPHILPPEATRGVLSASGGLSVCDLSLRVVEGRWVIGASDVGHRGADPSQFPFTSRSLFTHVGCLLATGFLVQKHLCVATMFVYIPQTPPPCSEWLCWSVFCMIATNSPHCVCCVARVRAVCFPHMIRSSRRIVEDDRGVAAEEP